jgi:Holliday junction resolvasome RuvABC endonuclease subunit
MIVLGIDPSLTCTALVALDASGAILPQPRGRHFIETRPKDFPSQIARLDAMRCALRDHVEMVRPSLAIVENYAFGAKIAREALGEWGGLLRVTLYRCGVPYGVAPPASLKAFVTGSGAAEKSLVLREVFRRWGYEARDDNDADAYGLAQLGVAFLRANGGEKLTERERKAVDKIERVPGIAGRSAA